MCVLFFKKKGNREEFTGHMLGGVAYKTTQQERKTPSTQPSMEQANKTSTAPN